MHLDIPSGTSIRFEPGEEKTVQLVAFGGRKRIYGLNNLTCAQIMIIRFLKHCLMQK